MKPITDTITRDHRTKLLTRRVRAIMRAFNKNPNYLSVTPNITWDDSFIPPELYDDLEKIETTSLDAEERQQVQKEEEKEWEKEEIREKIEEQMTATQNDKGKMKETTQDTENVKRKWTRKFSESSLVFDISGGNEGGISADEAEPPAKRVKRKKSIDNDGVTPVPPPCRHCTISRLKCIPNGWNVTCKNCEIARRTCSLSKSLLNDKGKAKETAEDNEKPDDTEKPKTQDLREIRTSLYALTKSILDDRSSSEDEEVDQLDEVPAKPSPKKKKISTTTKDGFIPNDPKVCLVNSSFSSCWKITVVQCDRCEESQKECFRRETYNGTSCTHCAKLRKGCNLTKSQKINFIPNDPKVCF